MNRILSITILLIVAGCGDSSGPGSVSPLSEDALLGHLEFLAGDSLYGRGSASAYELEAAEYIRDEFVEYGLQPGGDDYIWPFAVPNTGGQSRNVLGVLPGRGSLAGQWVVVGAHYDHIGWRQFPDSFVIYNGADDNASGTALVLELARYLSELYRGGEAGEDRRSIMFQAYGAEEIGLIGSNAFCADPTVPMDSIVAMINMDMVGRLRNDHLILNGAFSSSAWRLLLEAHNDDDLQLIYVDGVLLASDHRCFYQAQRPIMLFHTDLHDQYHQSSDDVELINLDGMVAIGDMLLGVLHELANDPTRPEFTPSVVTPRVVPLEKWVGGGR
jgi:hypothetical protein